MEKLLQSLQSIHELSPELLDYLMDTLQEKCVPKKTFLLRAGHTCQRIYFVEQGLLRCFYLKDDQEVCSWFMKEGDVVISVESFFRQSQSHESIQALEDTTVYSISFSELQYIYRHYPEFNFVGRVLTEQYYTLSEQRLYSLRMQRSQERYEYLLEHHPELILRVPAKYLASYLGLTEVTLSKIKGRR